eukprot:365157-Chlamydomonas_euryale.AAC.17
MGGTWQLGAQALVHTCCQGRGPHDTVTSGHCADCALTVFRLINPPCLPVRRLQRTDVPVMSTPRRSSPTLTGRALQHASWRRP